MAHRKPKQYRQGDVLLELVSPRPRQARAVWRKVERTRRAVLALGEATGHAHVIDAPEEIQVLEDAWARYFSVPKGAVLRHEAAPGVPTREHDSIPLPAGTYRLIRQREFTEEDERTVSD